MKRLSKGNLSVASFYNALWAYVVQLRVWNKRSVLLVVARILIEDHVHVNV